MLWGELDRATQAHGLATPGGRVTTTGVGGFTLGGGYGWLSPKYGLACDNLVGAEVVTADGAVVHCSETRTPTCCGGCAEAAGTSASSRRTSSASTRSARRSSAACSCTALEKAEDVLRAYREYVDGAPDELATAFALFPAPPEPFIPPALQGRTVLGILACYCGDVDEGIRRRGAAEARSARRRSTSSARCPTWTCRRCSTRPRRRAGAGTTPASTSTA